MGTRISVNGGQTWLTVVGIVTDVLQYRLDAHAVPSIYLPLSQTTNGLAGTILMRFRGYLGEVTARLREAVRGLDPEMPVEQVQTLDEVRRGHLAQPRERAFLLFVFAAVALTGVAGVLAYSASQRVHEFGVRLALGATRRSVLRLVLGQGLKLVAVGLVVGLIVSRGVTRLLTAYLFNTSPWEPSIFVAVTAAFLLAGLIAGAAPAHRATSVDPQVALRAE